MTKMQVLYALTIIVAFVAPVRSFGEFTQTGLQVKTTNGVVKGTLDVTNNVRLFQGIPYAKPPVGDLRWEYPQTPAPFSSVYKANFIAPGCPQDCQLPPGNCPLTYSEDCLYLTVFAPTVPPKEEAGGAAQSSPPRLGALPGPLSVGEWQTLDVTVKLSDGYVTAGAPAAKTVVVRLRGYVPPSTKRR